LRRILYIEDDAEIGGWVKEELDQRGYAVKWLRSGESAETEAHRHDLAILDVMLPGLDGYTVGQRLKKASPDTPVLMLTARTAVEDRLHGLQFADDYVTKPFYMDELAARIEVLLRRFGPALSAILPLGHIRINQTDNTVWDERAQREVMLTGKQHQILMYLLRHKNRILTKEQIYEAVWGEAYMEGDKSLMVHIRHLREKIELDPSAPAILETVRGIGYRIRL